MSDIDQIMEQILPFFAPHIFIRLAIPELNVEFDVKVIFQSCTPEVSLEMPDEDYRVINYTIDFVAQAWLFKPSKLEGGLIETILTNYWTSEEGLASALANTTSTFTSGASGGKSDMQVGSYDNDGNLVVDYQEFL